MLWLQPMQELKYIGARSRPKAIRLERIAGGDGVEAGCCRRMFRVAVVTESRGPQTSLAGR
jgi:hypothetical protein